jgi:nitroreductase
MEHDTAGIDAIEALMTTRAIRRYTSQPVSDAAVETCLRAAQQAPSGGNVQPQQYVVVRDPHLRSELGRLYREAFDRYEATLPDSDDPGWQRTRAASRHLADHVGEVPVVVLFLQPTIAWGSADADGPIDIGRLDASVYPAVQNFCVAARALGLGTALTTVIRGRSAEVFALLGIPPDRYEIAALTPLGYPAGRFGVAPRKPAEKVTHWDTWSNRRPFSSEH